MMHSQWVMPYYKQFNHISSHNQQDVSVAMLSHHISSHDQQRVSETILFFWHAISSYFTMTNSMWVTLPFFLPCHLITSHPWPTVCEWHSPFFLPCHLMSHISSHCQQAVSDTALFFCHAISSHLIPWPTGCKWHCPFFLPCHLSTSHTMINSMWVTWMPFFLPCHFVTSHPMTNRMWVTLVLFSTMLSHLILSHDQQDVSDTALVFYHAISSHLTPWPTAGEWPFFLLCHLITSHPGMTNRMWVPFFYAMPCHHKYALVPWPTASEWHSPFLPCHLILAWSTGCEWNHLFSLPCHLITYALILWPTASEWHCPFFSVIISVIPWSTGCEWHCPCHLIHLIPWPTACE